MSATPRTVQHSKKSAAALLAAASLFFPFATCAKAATLEQVYKQALEDPEFKTADEELNAAYSSGIRTLPKEERDKLRQAERFWIRENQELLQQNPQREVEVLKKRFLKRRDELLQLNASQATPSTAPAATASPPVAAVAPAPAPQTPKEGGVPRVWNEKAAANLERVYQTALQDTAFEAADSALRAVFKEAVSALNPTERDKLKPAQKAWVRENAVLVSADPAQAQSILTERVLQRRAELVRILEQRRFEPAVAIPQPPAPPQIVAPPPQPAPLSLPEPVFKEPSLPTPPIAQTPPASTEPLEPVLPSKGDKHEAGLTQIFWALLGTWVLGLGFFHYRAFAQKQEKTASNPPPALDVRGLYLATGTGFLVSLTPLLAAPSALTAIVAVLFTIVGLGTAKIAAEEWARSPVNTPKSQRAAERPPASVPAETSAAPVQVEVQAPKRQRKQKGNRQNRR